MGKKRTKKELQTTGAFEKALGKEVSVSAEFDLPLTVLALNVKGGWQEGDVRRALDALRTADLIAQSEELEILIALPNTAAADARMVEEKLRGTFPKATFVVAPYKRGYTAGDLLERARSATLKAAPETI